MFPTTNFKQFDYILLYRIVGKIYWKIEKHSLTFRAYFHSEESETSTNENFSDASVEFLYKPGQFKKKSECSGNKCSLVNGREYKRIDDFIG